MAIKTIVYSKIFFVAYFYFTTLKNFCVNFLLKSLNFGKYCLENTKFSLSFMKIEAEEPFLRLCKLSDCIIVFVFSQSVFQKLIITVFKIFYVIRYGFFEIVGINFYCSVVILNIVAYSGFEFYIY